jgi:N-acetylmuramoyl-L-alanine amidase
MAFFRALLAVCACALAIGTTPARAEGDAAGPAPLIASDMRLTAGDSHFKLELDFDRTPGFIYHYVDSPPRLIVDLPRTVFTLSDKAVKGQGIVSSIRYGTMAEGQARMVVALAGPARLSRSEAIAAGSGALLVLEGDRIPNEEFSKLIESQDWAAPGKATAGVVPEPAAPATDPAAPFLVAIDAGHGGIDTGASSADGKTLEKNITLAFARKIAAALNATEGMQAFLTRDSDRFLSLKERVEIARQRKANLFISLHADKLKQNDIRGATVYTISDRASDSLSASVAERENFSDELAGIEFVEEPAEVADILLDLTRRETQAFSVTLAQSVIQSFNGQIELINNPHRSAGFRVLRAPEIPSILLELGFLSNRRDEELLKDPVWQDKIARLLTEAILRYRQPGQVAATPDKG